MHRALLVAALLLAAPPLSAAPSTVELVVLETRDDTTEARAVGVTLEPDGRLRAEAPRSLRRRLVHAHDGVVRGALAGTELLVAAEQAGGADRSFSGALFVPERASPLVDHLAYAARPLVVGRRAYLQRGRAGVDRRDGSLRDDELSLVELDLDTLRARPVATMVGQLLYPVGVDPERGLIAYAVGPKGSIGEGGRLVAFDEAGQARDLGLVGTARDLSLVPRVRTADAALGPAVVYEAREGRARVVYAQGLDGRRLLLARGDMPLGPVPLPNGAVHVSRPGPAGRVELVRAIDPRSGLALVQRYEPGRPEAILVVRKNLDGTELVLPVAPGARLEPVGFLGAP